MRLFLYGTLLDADVLARRSGDPGLPARCDTATLHGWSRVALPRARWPTLRRKRGGVVTGAVVSAGAAAAQRLAAYEGPAYRLVPLAVMTLNRAVAARAWIAPGGTRRAWHMSVATMKRARS